MADAELLLEEVATYLKPQDVEHIREAIELYLECQIEDDRPVPEDKKTRLPKGAHAEEITVGIEFKVQAGFERKMSLAYAR